MDVKVVEERGYCPALFGVGLSYGVTSKMGFKDFADVDHIVNKESPYNKCKKVAQKLAFNDGGHNKMLESIVVWLDITASRFWWQEFDTYRVGVTKQSESTIHTLTKNKLTEEDFDPPISQEWIKELNDMIAAKDFLAVKAHLPESFLQRRIVCTNYKTLRNIILQRRSHKLKQWHTFIDEVLGQVLHSELLPKRVDK